MSQSQQPISVSDLDVSQLSEVRKQLEDELNHLTNSFAQLKQAQAKFKACIENVAEVKPQNKDKTILVPLTNSLYIPGRLSYFVKKVYERQAQKYYSNKVDFIRTNLDTLEATIQKKRDDMNYLINVMQAKIQAQTQTQAATKA
ncbi:hypothetical protein BD779DRAFT_1612346 [Infundibulicybe gibba]|nr:hypothetical protein BD779DRAFT_1612346 [Infundibulicybe gibba]